MLRIQLHATKKGLKCHCHSFIVYMGSPCMLWSCLCFALYIDLIGNLYESKLYIYIIDAADYKVQTNIFYPFSYKRTEISLSQDKSTSLFAKEIINRKDV